jgi:dienelactone hydrolase
MVAALFALVALASVGCGHGRAPVPLPGSPPVEIRELSLDDGFVTIRVDIPREPPGPKPAVLALFGERPRMLRAGLVTIGYQVHWERTDSRTQARPAPAPAATQPWGKWLLASPSSQTIGRGYFEVITYDATRVVPRVLDAVARFPEIDMTRLGIAGTSTTGFIALQAVAHDPRFTAAVVVAACGDYHRFLFGSTLAMDGAFLDLGAEYESWLHSIEPIRHPERLVHAAILLLSGAEDPVIPMRCVETTAAVLTQAYATAAVPERFRWSVLPGLGHAFVPALRDDMMAWWSEWLLSPRH